MKHDDNMSVQMRVPSVVQLQQNPSSVSDKHKLIVLSNPPFPHKVWEGALGSYEAPGSLHFASQNFTDVHIPASDSQNTQILDSNIDVKVSIQGRKLNPSVCAEIHVYHGNRYARQCVFAARIDWPFKPIKHLSGTQKSGVTSLAAHIDEAYDYLELSFVPQCAVSHNLLAANYDLSLLHTTDDANLSTSELSLIRDLADVVQNPNGRRVRVRFYTTQQERVLLITGDTQTPFGKLLEDLPTVNNLTPSLDFTSPRWRYYRKKVDDLFLNSDSTEDNSTQDSQETENVQDTGTITPQSDIRDTPPPVALSSLLQVSFDAMRSRTSILARPHPGTPIEALSVFHDREDALISLAYGAYLEYEEQNATFEAVRRDAHHARLCGIDNRVLALINFSSPPKTGLPNDRFRLDDRTKVQLRFSDHLTEGDKDCLTAKGLIVANVFNLPRCDLLVLITDKWAKSFRHLVCPIESFQHDEGESVWSTVVRVSPELYRCTYKAEVDAVTRAYGPSCPTDRLPFLLGDGSQILRCNPLRDAVSDRVALALRRLEEAKMWNEQQQKVIMSLTSAPAGALVVTGPGGTGKTELICHIVRFAIACGHYAMISGTRNDTLDDMTLKLDKLDPSLKPVRFYAPSQESLGSLYQSPGGSRIAGHEHHLLVSTFDAIEADTKRTRRSLPQFSVLGRLINNLSRDTPLMRRLRLPRTSSQKQPIQDARAYFRDRLHLLYQNHHNRKYPWVNGDDERELIFKAYKFLREEVVSEARVIITTNYVSGNIELGTNFAHDGDVWLFQDEAQSMTEASALIPLGLNNISADGKKTRKVAMHFLSGDLKQLPPFTVSRTGRYNTVNEFAAQRSVSLMERKLSSGFPAIPLVEQRRAAEVLMRGANIFHYGGKLTTPPHPPLEYALRNLIPSLGGFRLLPHHCQDRRRLAWLEVDAPVYENKYTGSRANPVNAAVVRNCLLKVRDTYGTQTSVKVMLATPYKRQKELYLGMACELKDTFCWSDKELPRIVTIDSLIGRESSLVILDLVNNGTEGFLRDVRRSCVAFTRAKDMFLVVGGKFTLSDPCKIHPKTLTDSVSGRNIEADMSRPLAFYYSFFKANNFMYQPDISNLSELTIPADLQPLEQDLEDQTIAENFTGVDFSSLKQAEQRDDWEFVEKQGYADNGGVPRVIENLAYAMDHTSL